MLSSSLRTMATCSGLPAISSSTWRRELSAAPWQGRDESSTSPATAARPSTRAALASGKAMAET